MLHSSGGGGGKRAAVAAATTPAAAGGGTAKATGCPLAIREREREREEKPTERRQCNKFVKGKIPFCARAL